MDLQVAELAAILGGVSSFLPFSLGGEAFRGFYFAENIGTFPHDRTWQIVTKKEAEPELPLSSVLSSTRSQAHETLPTEASLIS